MQYGTDRVGYSKFDAQSTEDFKMGAWLPKAVRGGKMEWNPVTKVLKVRATAKTVTILAGR